ncbi:MAG: hypothetical protein WDN49_19395 [Acetobacteraceae bacterium]
MTTPAFRFGKAERVTVRDGRLMQAADTGDRQGARPAALLGLLGRQHRSQRFRTRGLGAAQQGEAGLHDGANIAVAPLADGFRGEALLTGGERDRAHIPQERNAAAREKELSHEVRRHGD